MRAPDEILGGESFRLARTGAAAPDVDPRRPIPRAGKYGHAGAHPLIGGVSHRETRHVRDEVLRTGPIHGVPGQAPRWIATRSRPTPAAPDPARSARGSP